MPSVRSGISCQLLFCRSSVGACKHPADPLLPYSLSDPLCPIPSWSHPSLGSSCCDMTSQKLCCLVGVRVTVLGHKASVKDARPSVWAPLTQQAQECQCVSLSVWGLAASGECWAPPLLVLTLNVFSVRTLKSEVRAQICLDVKAMIQEVVMSHCPSDLMSPWRWLKFAAPHIFWNWSQVPISLWLVHLFLYPLLIKPASFPSLCCARCSHSLQACTYCRTKRHWGIFWIRQESASPWMLWSPCRYLSLPTAFVHFALWLRMVGKKKPSGVKWN